MLAVAAAAASRDVLQVAQSDLELFVSNGSGDASALPPALVHQLCSSASRHQRIVELTIEANRTDETARAEKVFRRQLQGVAERHRAAARADEARRQTSALLELISLRRACQAQASGATVVED